MTKSKSSRGGGAIIDNEPAPTAAKVVQTSTTRKEYVESVSPGEADEQLLLIEDAPQLSPLEEFLRDATQSQTFVLEIERLPNYQTDRRSSTAVAVAEYLDVWDFDSDSILNYPKQVQAAFGGGTYRFTLKYPPGYRDPETNQTRGGQMAKRWILTIGAPIRSTRAPDGRTVYVTQQADATAAPFDPLKMIREQTAMVRGVMELAREFQPPQVNGGGGGGQSSEVTLAMAEQSARMGLIEKLMLAPEKSPLAERVLMKLVGDSEEKQSSSWVPELIELGKAAIEILPDLLSRFTSAATAAPPVVAGVPGQPAQLPAPAPVQDQRSPSQIAYQRTLHMITQGMYWDDFPAIPLQAIDQLLQRHEEWQAEIDTMMSQPGPSVVTGLIAGSMLEQAPDDTKAHWATWIERLQAEWKASEPEEGENATQPS